MTVMVRSGSPNWFIDFTYRGHDRRRTSGVPIVQAGKTKTQTKREAEKIEDAWRKEIDDLVTSGRTKATLAEAMQRYYKTVILQGRTDGEDFLKKMKRILDGFGADTQLDAITETAIGTWADGLLDAGRMELAGGTWKATSQGLKARSVNAYLGILRCVLKKAATKKWNYLAAAPTVELYKLDDKKLRYLTIEEAGALIRAAAPSKFSAAPSNHLQQLVTFLLGTGGRKTESLELTWDYVNTAGNGAAQVTFADYTTKSGKSRTVPIHDTLRTMLIDMRAEQLRAGYTGNRVFVYKSQIDGSWVELQGVTKAFLRARRDAGLGADVTLHTLRHTYASWLVQADVGLAKVQELLGHANVETTMIYAHLAPQHLEAAVARLGSQMAALSAAPTAVPLAA